MGGFWVDYELMTSVTGLYCLGEANFLRSWGQPSRRFRTYAGTGRRIFVIPYTIGNYLSDDIRTGPFHDHPAFVEAENAVAGTNRSADGYQGYENR